MIRFLYILGLLAKYSWLYLLKKTKLYTKPDPKFVSNFFSEARGSFVKFGQLLALRVDLLPEEYSLEMLNLLDNLPPFSFSEVKKTFLQELGSSPDKLFKYFEKEPFASASFGQVHGAILADGQKVVVKVMRPNIEEEVAIDYFFIFGLAFLADLFFSNSSFSWKEFVREFDRWTKQELDYRIEAENGDKLANFYQNSQTVVIPRIYHHFTTKRILVLDFIDGYPLSRILRGLKDGRLHIQQLKELNIDIEQVPHKLTQELIKQYFIAKVFHADPHPGNIILTKDQKIGLVDFGIVGISMTQNETDFIQAVYHAAHFHFEDAIYHFAKFSANDLKQILISAFPATVDEAKIDQLTKDLANHFSAKVKAIILGNIDNMSELKKDYSRVFLEVVKAGQIFKVKLPSEALLFIRLLSIDGMLGKQLNKDFVITPELKYFFNEYGLENVLKMAEIDTPVKRINRELALEKLSNWLVLLQELDNPTYQVVKKKIESYNAFN